MKGQKKVNKRERERGGEGRSLRDIQTMKGQKRVNKREREREGGRGGVLETYRL